MANIGVHVDAGGLNATTSWLKTPMTPRQPLSPSEKFTRLQTGASLHLGMSGGRSPDIEYGVSRLCGKEVRAATLQQHLMALMRDDRMPMAVVSELCAGGCVPRADPLDHEANCGSGEHSIGLYDLRLASCSTVLERFRLSAPWSCKRYSVFSLTSGELSLLKGDGFLVL